MRPAERSVTLRGSPPARSRSHTCGDPERVETKASVLPSGEKRGALSAFSCRVRARGGAEPSAGTSQTSALRLPAARSVVVRTNATHLPSGDSCGSPTRTVRRLSSIVMGRAANAGTEKNGGREKKKIS